MSTTYAVTGRSRVESYGFVVIQAISSSYEKENITSPSRSIEVEARSVNHD
jgi:hypothetical protein